MNIQTRIEQKLMDAFEPIHLEVTNESYQHNVAPGSESHFKVVLVAEQFQGQRLISRHRSVNEILKEELANDIHALALHTYTESEWQGLYGGAPSSPACLGGMKRQASAS